MDIFDVISPREAQCFFLMILMTGSSEEASSYDFHHSSEEASNYHFHLTCKEQTSYLV